jgi:hypothetical protein
MPVKPAISAESERLAAALALRQRTGAVVDLARRVEIACRRSESPPVDKQLKYHT